MGGVLMSNEKKWFAWTTKEQFELWHRNIIDTLNLPLTGVNAATGRPAPQAQWTTKYTEIIEVSPNDWRAPVELWAATAFPVGLGAQSDPPPYPDLQWQPE